jgi:hypothetical protein
MRWLDGSHAASPIDTLLTYVDSLKKPGACPRLRSCRVWPATRRRQRAEDAGRPSRGSSSSVSNSNSNSNVAVSEVTRGAFACGQHFWMSTLAACTSAKVPSFAHHVPPFAPNSSCREPDVNLRKNPPVCTARWGQRPASQPNPVASETRRCAGSYTLTPPASRQLCRPWPTSPLPTCGRRRTHWGCHLRAPVPSRPSCHVRSASSAPRSSRG